MIDGIIKADGTSRLMRAELPATYEEFRTQCRTGTQPLDVLFNALGWSQLPTFLNKGNLASDGTLALFGLSANAVPDDVFSWLGNYNTHWWSALYDQGGVGYQEVKTNVTTDIWITNQQGNASHTFYYSKEISINQSTGAVSLKNPTPITIDGTYDSIDSVNATLNNLMAMAPVYITNIYKDPSGVYCLPAGSKYNPNTLYGTISRYRNDNGFYFVIGTQTNGAPVAQLVTSQLYNIPPGEKVYVHSEDRNAYPDNGEVNGVLYEYLGIPFQNAVTAPKIATGSYTGTGTYGASNPNSLTFDFEPKVVVITPPVNQSSVAGYSFIAIRGQTRAVCIDGNSGLSVDYYGEQLTWNEKTFSWYNKSSAQYQCNKSDCVYPYLAIG